jgi:hypothetical protein
MNLKNSILKDWQVDIGCSTDEPDRYGTLYARLNWERAENERLRTMLKQIQNIATR